MKTETTFAFEIGDDVKLVESAERGIVVGRAQFSYSDNSYLVRYQARDGRQVENWWTETALLAV